VPVALCLAVWLFAAPPEHPVTFALRVAIATDAGEMPVAQPAWLAQQIAQAQDLFAPFGVAFVRQDAPPLGPGAEPLETRADRNALAARVAPHVINVFIVGSLRDVDEPARMRRGVHWHSPTGVHYVIVIASAPPSVLAHELGHFFGNAHSQTPDNVMSYERTGASVFFDEAQGQRIEARVRAYVQSGELLPVELARASTSERSEAAD
jgi:hypothetical protein